jgi:hypothetical protein
MLLCFCPDSTQNLCFHRKVGESRFGLFRVARDISGTGTGQTWRMKSLPNHTPMKAVHTDSRICRWGDPPPAEQRLSEQAARLAWSAVKPAVRTVARRVFSPPWRLRRRIWLAGQAGSPAYGQENLAVPTSPPARTGGHSPFVLQRQSSTKISLASLSGHDVSSPLFLETVSHGKSVRKSADGWAFSAQPAGPQMH